MRPTKRAPDGWKAAKTLRTAAETIDQLDKHKIKELLLHAADMLELRDAQLWAVNDELVKAGLQPWQYDSFAACVAVLRESTFDK